MINRDSIGLTLAIIGAIFAFLITSGKPPTAWNYLEWLQAGAFAVATISAKLSTSPLLGKND